MNNAKYLFLLLILSSCASAIFTVGDRENPTERFANIADGVSFYKTLQGNKAFASNIGVQSRHPFTTRHFSFGGFCHNKETKDEAIDCALKQCETNVNGINRYGGYGSSVEDCVLMWVNDESLWSESKKDFDIRKGDSIREPLVRNYNYQIAEQKRKIEQSARLKKMNEEAQIVKAQEKRDAEIAKFQAFIDGIKLRCKSYGFTEENAIATCVQTEINNEITRFQAQQVYANAQARANAAQRNNALSNMGRCLSTEGNFAACGNAWNGYTPKPAKKVYRCDYDVFGNQITSTCREK